MLVFFCKEQNRRNHQSPSTISLTFLRAASTKNHSIPFRNDVEQCRFACCCVRDLRAARLATILILGLSHPNGHHWFLFTMFGFLVGCSRFDRAHFSKPSAVKWHLSRQNLFSNFGNPVYVVSNFYVHGCNFEWCAILTFWLACGRERRLWS